MTDGPFFVTFTIANQPRRVPTPDHEPWSMEDLIGGFWITENHALCREAQGTYWIPPSQVVLIEKRNKPPQPM